MMVKFIPATKTRRHIEKIIKIALSLYVFYRTSSAFWYPGRPARMTRSDGDLIPACRSGRLAEPGSPLILHPVRDATLATRSFATNIASLTGLIPREISMALRQCIVLIPETLTTLLLKKCD
jgi:hypothetical protein